MTDPQSFNRYSYVQNDPVNFVDPLGLDDEPPDDLDRIITNIWGRHPSGVTGFTGGETGITVEDPPTDGGGDGGGGGGWQDSSVLRGTVSNCRFPTYDQLSAAQQGLLNAGAYGGLSDAQRANFLNQTGALARVGINLGNAALQAGPLLTDRLLFQPGDSLVTFRGSIEGAIASGTFIKDTPVASKHPGMSDFGARQNRTFNALQVGFGPAGAFVDIDRGNPSGGLAGLIVHGAEVLTPGKTDPFAVGRKLGQKVTGYTCK